MSSEPSLRVAVSMRVDEARGTKSRRDGLAHEWMSRLRAWNVTPFLVPNTWPDLEALLNEWDVRAVLLTCGNSPVVDGYTGTDAAPERDRTERILVDYARARDLPVVGTCRGAHILNLCAGGSLSRVSQPGSHLESEHIVHFAPWVGVARGEVTSDHDLVIANTDLADELQGFAWAGDGTVEGFVHAERPWLGVLWHPEREAARPMRLDGILARVLAGDRPWEKTRGDRRWHP
ncbi:MAG: gamma-glutamyl-gamma-aminobutyrate hydrolase family protein [Acidimicrobiia bacterium]|nr:gamma-glutamyl-gamma-aminobutyrate hydrolase family protein [Acidimicrobiia bacterium]